MVSSRKRVGCGFPFLGIGNRRFSAAAAQSIDRWSRAAGAAVRAEIEQAVVRGLADAFRRMADQLPALLAGSASSPSVAAPTEADSPRLRLLAPEVEAALASPPEVVAGEHRDPADEPPAELCVPPSPVEQSSVSSPAPLPAEAAVLPPAPPAIPEEADRLLRQGHRLAPWDARPRRHVLHRGASDSSRQRRGVSGPGRVVPASEPARPRRQGLPQGDRPCSRACTRPSTPGRRLPEVGMVGRSDCRLRPRDPARARPGGFLFEPRPGPRQGGRSGRCDRRRRGRPPIESRSGRGVLSSGGRLHSAAEERSGDHRPDPAAGDEPRPVAHLLHARSGPRQQGRLRPRRRRPRRGASTFAGPPGGALPAHRGLSPQGRTRPRSYRADSVSPAASRQHPRPSPAGVWPTGRPAATTRPSPISTGFWNWSRTTRKPSTVAPRW